MLVGYARVSSTGQSLEIQLDALRAAGCLPENIYSEKISGTTADRPQLKELQRFVREGDTVVITKLDRLGRSLNDLSNIVEGFKQEGVEFAVLDQGIDTSTPTGKLMFNMLSSFAEFETAIRYERQMSGIKAAQAKGVKFGRKPTVTIEQVVAAHQQHGSMGKAAKALGVSKTTIHRHLKANG